MLKVSGIECGQECSNCDVLNKLVDDVFLANEIAGIESGAADATMEVVEARQSALQATLEYDGDPWIKQAIELSGTDLSPERILADQETAETAAKRTLEQRDEVEDGIDLIEAVRKGCANGRGIVIEGPRVDVSICLKNPSLPNRKKIRVQGY